MVVACNNATCGCTGTPLDFTKIAVIDICSTTTLTLNAWQCVGAVVTSTNVRFLVYSASGALTAQNVANSSAFNTAGSPVLNVEGSGSNSAVHGSSANVAVWQNAALSDAEFSAFCFQGLSAVGRKPAGFWPMFNTAAAFQVQGDLGTGTTSFFLTGNNTPTTVSHSPTGNPFQRH